MPTTCEPITADEFVANTRIESPDETRYAGQNGEPVGSMPVGRKKLRVLVVDDCKDAADSLAVLLNLWGHDANVAYDGPSAYQAACTDRRDVMLVDIAMPNLNGYDLAGQLRRLHGFEETLLIAMSGYADEAHRGLGAAAGFDHYLPKPIELGTLEKLLLREKERLARPRGRLAQVGLPSRNRKPVGV